MKKAIKFDKFSALYFDQNKDSNKIAVAKEEGLAEGEHRKAVETAKNMLFKGLDIELVSQCTGLTTEEIKFLL